jgi:hypothetical protein
MNLKYAVSKPNNINEYRKGIREYTRIISP